MEYAVVVVYDISDDNLRRDVENTCKGFGMSHVQRSLFVGIMKEERRRALYNELERLVNRRGGEFSIRIYRINLRDYEHLFKIGKLSDFEDDPIPERLVIG